MAVVDQQAMMEVTSDAPVSELVIPDTSEVVDQPMASPKISSNPASTIVKINLKSASPNALTTEQKDSIKHSSGVNGVTDEQRLIKSSQSDIEDIFEDDSELSQQKHPCAIFRPQLDDIMLDQDLLDLYEQLKFLVSLSPLKTAQVLFAFSSATDHLALELEVRKSALDMNKKAFTFYQDNTWFAVDLEPPLDISDDEAYESDPKFKILPARHALFPAFQRQKPWDPTPSSHLPHHYYYPYPYPYEHPLPAQYPAESGVFSEQRRSRDRERHYRSYRHGTKSSKRRSSRDLESSPQRLPGSMHDGRLLKRSRHDIDSPSLPSGDTAGRYSMEPESPTASREAEPRHRIKDGDNDGDDDDQQRKLSRIERRLARKKLKQANKLRLQREAEEQRLASGETSKEKDGTESGSSVIVRGRPFKITLVQSGKPLSSTLGQSSSGDSAGFDRPKPLHGWIPPSEQGDNENSGQPGAPSQRSIRPNSESQTSGVEGDAGSKGQSQKPGAINTQVMGRKSKNIQATPIQATGSSGSQSPHVGSGGPLYTDKSEDKLKKGTWTSQEEEILLEAVRDLSSENWHAVAMKVPGRNAKQCMQKWQTDLDPRINRQPWTAEEDEKLVEAYHTFGNSWQQIAKMVETRTWYQCYNRVRAKSVKTKIMMTAGSHPASLANTGGRTSSNSLDGSKAGSKDMEPKKPAKEAQGRGATSSPTTVESRAKTDAGQISTQNSSSSSDKPIQDSPAVTSGGSQYQQLASVPARQQDTIVSDERASSPKAQPPSQSHQQSQHQSPRDQQQPQQPQPQQSPQSQQPQQPQTQPPPQPQHVHHNQQHQHPSQTSHPHEQQSSVHQVKAPSSDAAAYWPKPSINSSPHAQGVSKDYRSAVQNHEQQQQQQQAQQSQQPQQQRSLSHGLSPQPPSQPSSQTLSQRHHHSLHQHQQQQMHTSDYSTQSSGRMAMTSRSYDQTTNGTNDSSSTISVNNNSSSGGGGLGNKASPGASGSIMNKTTGLGTHGNNPQSYPSQQRQQHQSPHMQQSSHYRQPSSGNQSMTHHRQGSSISVGSPISPSSGTSAPASAASVPAATTAHHPQQQQQQQGYRSPVASQNHNFSSAPISYTSHHQQSQQPSSQQQSQAQQQPPQPSSQHYSPPNIYTNQRLSGYNPQGSAVMPGSPSSSHHGPMAQQGTSQRIQMQTTPGSIPGSSPSPLTTPVSGMTVTPASSGLVSPSSSITGNTPSKQPSSAILMEHHRERNRQQQQQHQQQQQSQQSQQQTRVQVLLQKQKQQILTPKEQEELNRITGPMFMSSNDKSRIDDSGADSYANIVSSTARGVIGGNAGSPGANNVGGLIGSGAGPLSGAPKPIISTFGSSSMAPPLLSPTISSPTGFIPTSALLMMAKQNAQASSTSSGSSPTSPGPPSSPVGSIPTGPISSIVPPSQGLQQHHHHHHHQQQQQHHQHHQHYSQQQQRPSGH